MHKPITVEYHKKRAHADEELHEQLTKLFPDRDIVVQAVIKWKWSVLDTLKEWEEKVRAADE